MSYLPHIEVFADAQPVLNSEKFLGEVTDMGEDDMKAIFEKISKAFESPVEDEVTRRDDAEHHEEMRDEKEEEVEEEERGAKVRDEL